MKELVAAVITGFYLLFLISVSGCSSLPLVFLEPNEWLSFQPLVSSAALSVSSLLPHDVETALLPALPPVLPPSHLVGKRIFNNLKTLFLVSGVVSHTDYVHISHVIRICSVCA